MKSNPSRTLFRTLFATGLIAAGLCSCCPKHNTLTQAEIADGWQLRFDGKSLDQWKDFNGDSLTMPWHVVDGCIQAAGDGSDLSGYIVTKKQYENFILDWDWKLSYGGNSGMLYHVVENPYFKVPYVTGPEYQLIDNDGWEAQNAPTKLEPWQRLGVDYAMHLPDADSLFVNPQGEWNSSRIVCDNGHVEHWLNGRKILEFEAWADRVVAASVKKLESLVIEAQEELENLQSETPDDGNAIAVARAKLRKAEQQLAKKQNQTEQETTDTTSWTELHRVLTDVIGTFNEVGDAVGYAGGTIIATAGDIAGSTLQIINAVQAYRKAQAASNTLGMASGILGGISAGIGALTTIVNLFKGGETSMERNLRLAREFNEELRIMKERSRIDSDEFDNIFGDRVYDRYKQNIDVVRTSLEELEKVRERILSRGEEKYQLPGEWRGGAGTGLSGLFRYEKTWENIADSIANMQVQTRHSTWFRSAKYQSLGPLLPELFTDGEADMDALRQFVEEGGETFQHLARENQEMLREMVDDWETYEEALTAVRDYLQDIFGDLGSTLTDALVDAFENGTDAANTFVDSVGQALRLLGKRMASSIVFGKLFEDTQKRIEKVMQSDLSDEERFAQWSETMKSLVSGVMDQQDDFNRLWEEFRRIAKENGFSIDEEAGTSQQNGKAGATQTVTQVSFSRVEGLVTSVQIHSANIDENTEGIVPVLKGSLEAMNAIRENTEPIPQIYELLQTIKRDGLKAI